jgi:cell division protein FtsZ
VAGGSDLGLFEINEAASLVQEAAHPDANIIFGTVIDDSLGDEVRVTVIAAGFDSGTPTHKKLDPAAFRSGSYHSTQSPARGSLPSSSSGGNGHARKPGDQSSDSPSAVGGGSSARGFSYPSNAPASPSRPSIPPQGSPRQIGQPGSGAGSARPVVDFDDDDVDVPPFMRR